MARDLSPDQVLAQLKRNRLSPLYLFYGEGEFQLEKTLEKIRNRFIPEGVRDFNVQVFYGDETDPSSILDAACSLPFMSENRLIILRRTEVLSDSRLQIFLPYLDRPVASTCLIFVSAKPDFRKSFYKKLREMGCPVRFRKLHDREAVSWIHETAQDMGINMERAACAYLQQIVGNRPRDLHSELEKLRLRYGEAAIRAEDVKELAIHSRIYTVFELMDQVSLRRRDQAVSVLNRFLQEEGAGATLRVMGMLNRQVRLLWKAVSVLNQGGREKDVARSLNLRGFPLANVVKQARRWTEEELEEALELLYEADGHLKSGGEGRLVLENLILSLCG